MAPNTAATLDNDYCSVSGITKSMSGTTLSVGVTLTFKPSMAGTQSIFLTAGDSTGLSNPGSWVSGGNWTVPGNQLPSVVAITSNPTQGMGGVFTATFRDPNGYQNIAYTHTLMNSGLSAPASCMTYYDRRSGVFHLSNDAANGWFPLGPNATDSVSNSQCTLLRQGTSVNGSGTDLTLTLNFQFARAFAGTKQIYGFVIDNGWTYSNWQAMGFWEIFAGQYAPSVVIDVPGANANVTGTVQIAGWALDSTQTPEGPLSSLQVFIDGAPLGNVTYGVSRPDVCGTYPGRVGCPNVGYTANWDTTGAAAGNHTIRVQATDSHAPTARTTYVDRVVTLVSSTPTPPNDPVATILPGSTGNVLKIRGTYSDANGAADLMAVHMTVGQDVTWLGSCGWHLTPAGLHLINNQATAWLAPVAPNTSATVQNDYCTVSEITKTVSGTSLIVEVTLTLKPSMAGAQSIYLLAGDSTGYLNPSTWVSGGAWTVPGNEPPSVISITPASGSGSSRVFTAVFRDPNGFQNIRYVHTLMNSSLNGAGACYTYYDRNAQRFSLLNDAGAWALLGPNAGDSQSNSQCTLFRSGPGASGNGSDLTVTYNIRGDDVVPFASVSDRCFDRV